MPKNDRYVTLDGYIVKAVSRTGRAIGIVKTDNNTAQSSPIWLPRSVMRDGDSIDVGDTDLECQIWLAEKEGLDF